MQLHPAWIPFDRNECDILFQNVACSVCSFKSLIPSMSNITRRFNPVPFWRLPLRVAWPALLAMFCAVSLGAEGAKSKSQYAAEFNDEISQKVLPFWYHTAIDQLNGGIQRAAE